MDASHREWYFSTVRRTPRSPLVVEFSAAKYGRRLLVDAGCVSRFDNFTRGGRPHALSFYDIVLITRGRGWFALDDETHRVETGSVFFTRPGDVRQWQASGVDGACIFFTSEFIADAFSDPRFLDQFAYFRSDRASGRLKLPPRRRREYLRCFRSMQREIATLRRDASDALRAVLYELLVMLNRWYVAQHGEQPARRQNATVRRFLDAVDREFASRHRVGEYAAALGVSPGHLNTVCREQLRRSASVCIRSRIALEARRLLHYTDMTAAEVGYALGFEDPAYFTRFFTRETGTGPRQFRTSRDAGAE
jgi:AraC-like DNA-binding protein